jgi:hypothetical protein
LIRSWRVCAEIALQLVLKLATYSFIVFKNIAVVVGAEPIPVSNSLSILLDNIGPPTGFARVRTQIRSAHLATTVA